MPDNPELIEKYEGKLHQIMLNMRHDGIRHEAIHHLFNECTKNLEIMACAEKGLEDSPRIP